MALSQLRMHHLRTGALPPRTDEEREFCEGLEGADAPSDVVCIEHTNSCACSRPDYKFQALEDRAPCTCDFGARLGAFLTDEVYAPPPPLAGSDVVRIEHESSCACSKPEYKFQALEDRATCTCNFMERLNAFLTLADSLAGCTGATGGMALADGKPLTATDAQPDPPPPPPPTPIHTGKRKR